MRRAVDRASLEKVEAIFRNPALYELADQIPAPGSEAGGRPRTFPRFMTLGYAALISVYRSARQVEAELSHPLVWRHIRDVVRSEFPDRPEMHLPPTPMRRHHFLYARERDLAEPAILERLSERARVSAVAEARRQGLLDPHGGGSWTSPSRDRLLYADGKVIAPLFRAKPGDERVDRETGGVLARRAEPDAALHFEGDGEAAWGTKFVMVAARGEKPGTRVLLDIEPVREPGAEAARAMDCFRRLAPLVPGAQAVVYDTALRGMHHQELLRDLGLLPVNRVAAASKGAKTPRRSEGRRVPKNVHVEDKNVATPGGEQTVSLYAQDGAVGVVALNEVGQRLFEPLRRARTHRIADKSGSFRWYNDYELPERLGAGTVTVRLHGNQEDQSRRFNRPENVRVIAPSDPRFEHLYSRRNDAESINRHLEDTLFLRRAHSIGMRRQHVDLLGYALLVNGMSRLRHERSPAAQAA
jgi:hypothetical protein